MNDGGTYILYIQKNERAFAIFFLRSETSCPCILKFGCSVCSLTVIEFDILLHSVLLLFLRSMFMSSEHNVIFTGIENFVD